MKTYLCGKCKQERATDEMPIRRWDGSDAHLNRCSYCLHDDYFFSIAQHRIRTIYKTYTSDCCTDLIEIEVALAKIRYIFRGGDTTFVTFKKETNMITQVNNSMEMRQALNENLHAILTKKRKLIVAKEVNNTLGKILADVKMELMQKALIGDKEPLSWFNSNPIQNAIEAGVGISRITYKETA